jgi:hypothetical protein
LRPPLKREPKIQPSHLIVLRWQVLAHKKSRGNNKFLFVQREKARKQKPKHIICFLSRARMMKQYHCAPISLQLQSNTPVGVSIH